MTLSAILRAMPGAVWLPIIVAVLACLAIGFWYARARIRRRDAVAPLVAGLVALGAGIGLATLVVATTLVTFGVGLSQRSTPSTALLLQLASGVSRVYTLAEGDSASLARHLSLLDAGDRRVAWAVLSTLPCDAAASGVRARGAGLSDRAAAIAAQALRSAVDARGTPLRLGDLVTVVVPVPVRDAVGAPIGRLLIGFDAASIVDIARATGWATLAFAVCFWLALVLGTQRAVSQSVSERLRALADAVTHDDAMPPVAAAPVGELAALGTAIERATARAAREAARFRTIFEQAPAGIAWCAADGRVGAANPHLRRVLDLTDDAPLPPWDAVFVDADALAQFRATLRERRDLAYAAWRWRDAMGKERLVRGAVVALPSPTDDASAVLLVEDESERRALESQLLRAQKMDAVGKLAGGIAHDFNNLLTIIRSNAALLADEREAAELGAIDDAAARGARLVRRLLAITRDDQLRTTPQSVGPLLHETIALVRRVLPARIRVDAPAEVPAAVVALDHDTVQQSLLNLMLNARDAIREVGVITLDVRIVEAGTEAGADHDWLVLSVSDTGVGMAADVLERATEPFFTTKPTDQGSGLGLSVVYGTMTRHGGRLELSSVPGAGTRAALWFPVLTDAAAEVRDAPVAPRRAGGAPQRVQLLLVEDEYAVRVATERTLRSLGHEVASVGDIHEAARVLEAEPRIALVVSDVMMPGGSGLDLLRRVRASGSRVPFLFVSGYAVDSLEGTVGVDAAVDVLTKPWTVAELAERVQAALGERRAAD